MSANSLLLYYPDPVVLYSESFLSSCQRFDMHDGGTVISVDWFGAGLTSRGERWDFDILEIWIELCVVRGGSRVDDGAGDGVLILVEAVLMDRKQRRRYLDGDIDADKELFGFNLLPEGSDGFVSALLHGPGAIDCAHWFTYMTRDMTSERMRVRMREGGGGGVKGPPSMFSSSSASADAVEILAKGGIVMEMTMTRGMRYLSFR